MERLKGMSARADERPSDVPCGISHVAVVTADLDGFRTFYEEVIGLETAVVLGAGTRHGRGAVVFAGDAMLHVFEVPGYDPAATGQASTMFGRGRLDHFGFTVVDEAALRRVRDRLLAAGATSGDIRPLGPMLSVRFQDPDGLEGEISCFNPDFDPSAVRPEDEVVDPHWVDRARRVLHSPPEPDRHEPSRGTP